jgi:putative Mn2+ efflux pump MntP
MEFDDPTIRALLVSTACMAVGALAGYFLSRFSTWAAVGLAVLLMGGAAALISLARQSSDGYEGLAQALIATVFLSPAAFGVMFGAIVGKVRRRRSRKR